MSKSIKLKNDTYWDIDSIRANGKSIGYIVESGRNEYGDWIKFSNGLMICERTIKTTLACDGTWGNLFVGQDETVWNFAQEFVEIPKIIRDLRTTTSTSAWLINYSAPIVTKKYYQYFSIARATISTSVQVEFTIRAIGKWK